MAAGRADKGGESGHEAEIGQKNATEIAGPAGGFLGNCINSNMSQQAIKTVDRQLLAGGRMDGLVRKISSAALSAPGLRAFVVISLLAFVVADGAGLSQALAGRHGQGQGHDKSQAGGQGAGLGGGSVGGALGGGAGNGASSQSSAGDGSEDGSDNGSRSAFGNAGANLAAGASDPQGAKASASTRATTGDGNYVGVGTSACSTEPDVCLGETDTGLHDSAPLAIVSLSRQAMTSLQASVHRSTDGALALGASGGAGYGSDILAVYSTAELADLPSGTIGSGGAFKPDYGTDTLGWKAEVLTPVMGRMAPDGPVVADAAGTSGAAAQTDQALFNGYRIWMGNFVSERSARLYWAHQVRRFPGLLHMLKPIVRRIRPETAHASTYRLLGGSLADRATAEHLCGSIESRSPLHICRVVLD